jgi:hypothetical protein
LAKVLAQQHALAWERQRVPARTRADFRYDREQMEEARTDHSSVRRASLRDIVANSHFVPSGFRQRLPVRSDQLFALRNTKTTNDERRAILVWIF